MSPTLVHDVKGDDEELEEAEELQMKKCDLPPPTDKECHEAKTMPTLITAITRGDLEFDTAAGSTHSGRIKVPLSWAPYFGLETGKKHARLEISTLRGDILKDFKLETLTIVMQHLHTVEIVYRFGLKPHVRTFQDTAAVVLLLLHLLVGGSEGHYGILSPLSDSKDKKRVEYLMDMANKAQNHTAVISGNDITDILTTSVRLIIAEENPFLFIESRTVEAAVDQVAKYLISSVDPKNDSDITDKVHTLASAALKTNPKGDSPEGDGTVYGILIGGILAWVDAQKLKEGKKRLKRRFWVQSGLAGIGFAPAPFAGLAGLAMAAEQYYTDHWLLTRKDGREALTARFMADVKYGVLKYGRPDFASLGKGFGPTYDPQGRVSFILWLQTALEACGRL